MKTKTIIAALALTALAMPALAGKVDEYVTADNAILCVSSFHLEEGTKAAITGDEKWMKEVGCVYAQGNLPVKWINDETWRTGGTQKWQVRVTPPDGGSGVTVWGYYYAFTSKSGAKIDPYGWTAPR